MDHRNFCIISAVIVGLAIMGVGCTGSATPQQSYQQVPAPATTVTPTVPAPSAALPANPPNSQTIVTITNFSFQPASIAIKAGTTVMWTNSDPMAHTITADDGSFDSGPIAAGATFSHTFTEAGSVAYHCAIHTSMHGSISITQ